MSYYQFNRQESYAQNKEAIKQYKKALQNEKVLLFLHIRNG